MCTEYPPDLLSLTRTIDPFAIYLSYFSFTRMDQSFSFNLFYRLNSLPRNLHCVLVTNVSS
jgi:hypothetical protein